MTDPRSRAAETRASISGSGTDRLPDVMGIRTARKRLRKIMRRVVDKNRVTILTDRKGRAAALVPLEEWAALQRHRDAERVRREIAELHARGGDPDGELLPGDIAPYVHASAALADAVEAAAIIEDLLVLLQLAGMSLDRPEGGAISTGAMIGRTYADNLRDHLHEAKQEVGKLRDATVATGGAA